MISLEEKIRLKVFAAEIRIEALKMIASAGKGHVGGTMSIADAIAVLYGKEMRVDPNNPAWEQRDRLVMSKGHCGCAVYAALLLKKFFPEQWGETLNALGTCLPSHCDRTKTPGIDMSTGSLGQGLSVASGIAWATAQKGLDVYTYCILGDGECQEGQVWEAMMFAGHKKLSRLIAFVDGNKKQVDGLVCEIMPTDEIDKHAKLFGWHTQRVNGHDVEAIINAIDCAKSQHDRPSMIYLETTKGKDCIFAENLFFNHGISVTQMQLKEAVRNLEEKIIKLRNGEEI